MEDNNRQSVDSTGQGPTEFHVQKLKSHMGPRLSSIKLIHVAIGLLALMLIGLLIRGYFTQNGSTILELKKTPTVLRIESVELSGLSEIRIVFNDEIDLHVLEHSLAVTPSSNGQLIEGSNGREFYYRNAEDFPFSSTVLVEINQGLQSKNHLTLLSPETFWLQTTVADDQVSFSKDGMWARVISGTEGVPFKLQVEAGRGIAAHTIRIYKSNEKDLLQYLVYKIPESEIKKDGSYYEYAAAFTTDYFEYPESSLVESYDMRDAAEGKELNLPKGIYYIEALNGGRRAGSVFAIVNSKGLIVRQDDRKTIMGAFDLVRGNKILDQVNARFYTMRDTPTVTKTREFSGAAELDTEYKDKVDLILASVGDETMMVPLRIRDSMADIRVRRDLDTDMQMFIYTDRPIYKPGDTVFYRGTVRMDNDALYNLPPEGTSVRVYMDGQGKDLYDEVVPVDKNGLFSGNFIVPKDAVGDWQGITVTRSGLGENESDYDNYSRANFAVREYKKPTFELNTTKNKEEYYRHEKMNLEVKGAFFDSKPLKDEKVNYKVYALTYYEQEKRVYNQNFNITQFGGMCGGGGWGDYFGEEVISGEVKLNDKGMADLEIDLKNLKLPKTSQMLTVIVSKNDDKTGNTIESAVSGIVHAGAYNIFFIPAPSSFRADEEVLAPLYIESSIPGEELPKEVTFEFRGDNWNTDGYEGKEDLTGKVVIDENGKGMVRFPASKLKGYSYLTIVAEDKNKNSVEVQKYVSVTTQPQQSYDSWPGSNPDQTFLKIVTDSNSYVVGDKIRMNIISPQDLDVIFAPERGRIYNWELLHLSKGENKLEIPIPDEMSPSITMTFSFFAKGAYYSEGVALNVPSMHKLMQVELYPDKESYQPNETAMIKVVTRDAKGNKIPAQFSMGVVDEAIYGLRRDATPLIHTTFYSYRARSTNASSSLTPIGSYGGRGGGGGGGEGGAGKLVDTLFWAPILQTGENGELVVPVKLANVKTVWRIQAIASDSFTNLGQSMIKIPVK